LKWHWVEDDVCPLCGNKDAKPLYAKAMPYPLEPGEPPTCEPKFLQLIYHECPDCAFRFMNPRPSPESYRRYYAGMTYRSRRAQSQDEMDKGEQERSDNIQTLIPLSATSHLDVGCSRGYLLESSRQLGREVLGVEPNSGYTIEGIPVVPHLDDVNGLFDVVTCIHTLEHVNDPAQVAVRLVDLTKPGGTLIVEVPRETFPGESAGLPHPWAFRPEVIKFLFSGLLLDRFIDDGNHPVFVMTKPEV
jgi:SAM-dependent methyltransferase